MGRERERNEGRELEREEGGKGSREEEKTGQECKAEGKFLCVHFADENYLRMLETERKEPVE